MATLDNRQKRVVDSLWRNLHESTSGYTLNGKDWSRKFLGPIACCDCGTKDTRGWHLHTDEAHPEEKYTPGPYRHVLFICDDCNGERLEAAYKAKTEEGVV